mgnify:CR=1 FL=1
MWSCLISTAAKPLAPAKEHGVHLALCTGKQSLEAADVDRFVKKILGNLKFKLGIEIR